MSSTEQEEWDPEKGHPTREKLEELDLDNKALC